MENRKKIQKEIAEKLEQKEKIEKRMRFLKNKFNRNTENIANSTEDLYFYKSIKSKMSINLRGLSLTSIIITLLFYISTTLVAIPLIIVPFILTELVIIKNLLVTLIVKNKKLKGKNLKTLKKEIVKLRVHREELIEEKKEVFSSIVELQKQIGNLEFIVRDNLKLDNDVPKVKTKKKTLRTA